MGRGKQFMAVTSSLPSSLLPLICGIVLLVNVAGVVRRHCGAKRAQKNWEGVLLAVVSQVVSFLCSLLTRLSRCERSSGVGPPWHLSLQLTCAGAGGKEQGSPPSCCLPLRAQHAQLPPGLVPGLKVLLGACSLPCWAGSHCSAAAPCNLSPDSVWCCRVPVPPPCISQPSLTGFQSLHPPLGFAGCPYYTRKEERW